MNVVYFIITCKFCYCMVVFFLTINFNNTNRIVTLLQEIAPSKNGDPDYEVQNHQMASCQFY